MVILSPNAVFSGERWGSTSSGRYVVLSGFPVMKRGRILIIFFGICFRDIFKNITGLTVQNPAYLFQCTKTDAFDLAGFEQGQVLFADTDPGGKVFRAYFAARHDHIKIYDYCHESLIQTGCFLRTDGAPFPSHGQWRQKPDQEEWPEYPRCGVRLTGYAAQRDDSSTESGYRLR